MWKSYKLKIDYYLFILSNHHEQFTHANTNANTHTHTLTAYPFALQQNQVNPIKMSTYPVKMDSKFSLPANTADYMKQLERRIRELESQLLKTEDERSKKTKTAWLLFAMLKKKDVEIKTLHEKVELRTSQIRQLMEKFKDVISDNALLQSQNEHLTTKNSSLVSLCEAQDIELTFLRAQLAK